MNRQIEQLIKRSTTAHTQYFDGLEYTTEYFDCRLFARLVVIENAKFIQDLATQRVAASEYPQRMLDHWEIQ